MELLAVRVDAITEDTKSIFQSWLEANSTKFLIYEEIGDVTKKLHYQGVVQLDLEAKSIDAWRKNIKDLIRPTGKNQHSLATIKKDKYVIYITKDKKKVCWSGFTDEEIAELESQSYKKGTGHGKENFAERLYQKCNNELVRFYMEVDGKKYMKPIDRCKLVTLIIKEFCGNTKVFDRNVIGRFATMIENKLLIEHAGIVSEDLVNRIVTDML